jgi:hypothetical protein
MRRKRKMANIDMWYGDNQKEADKIDISFYPNVCEYRGNIYKNGKIIGDYSCKDSVLLEKAFPQLSFNWD